MKLQYAVVFEQTPNNYAAYAPDVPGCISAADTWEEIQEMMREALALYLEVTLEDGDPIPEPRMSLEDAIAHHCQVLAEYREKTPSYDDWPPSLSVTFTPIQIEVPAPQPQSYELVQ